VDQFTPFTTDPYRPLQYMLPLVSASYVHERQHKRELRTESSFGVSVGIITGWVGFGVKV